MDTPTVSGVIEHINDWQLGLTRSCVGKRVQMRRLLTHQQGQPGAYAGMFAPTAGEIRDGYRVITGERMTHASARHIFAEEALRALIMMKPTTKSGKAAIENATNGLLARLANDEQRFGWKASERGTYCCGKCSVAFWRALAAGAFDHQTTRLQVAMKALNMGRDGKSGWRPYPFYYTVAALTEIDSDLATAELRYAEPAIERKLARLNHQSEDPVQRRRHRYLTLALDRIA